MQPPPRKGKVTTALRNIHNEQLLKLQTKHQQDADFLEDIRNFTKMRAAVEKEYAQALLKLATTYLQRKCPTVPDVKGDGGESYKTVYVVWKTMLDETEKIAKARLAATEVYQQQVSESAKSVKMYKLQVAKKCFDNLRKMHDEIQQCVLEIDKSKKLYFEEEHMAHEARDKAHDADEKLKRKKGRIFQSISSLQKNSAKFSFRREACDIQATKARNDYVLALVAANAHQEKFYDIDLPELIQFIDCDIYDKVKEYILLISRTELLTCAACQTSFTIVQEQANMATKQYTSECFFHDNPVLSKPVLYEFEPCDNDQITKLSIEHNAGLCLSKEARRWATCLAKETRVIRDSNDEIRKLQAQLGDKPPVSSGVEQQGPQADIEQRIDELRQTARRAETSKRKAEARLEAMKESGVNVDEWVRTSDSDSIGRSDSPAELLSRSGTVISRTSQRSYQSEAFDAPSEANDVSYDSDLNEGNLEAEPVFATDTTDTQVYVNETQSVSDFASAVDVVAAVQSAWDAAAEEVEEFVEEPPQDIKPEQTNESVELNGERPASIPGQRCVALFSYQATNSDELSFVEQEELELVGEGDGDGWAKARNYLGEEGYIPQSYVEVLESQTMESSSRPPLTSFSSVDYTMPNEDSEIETVEQSYTQEKEIPDSLDIIPTVNGYATEKKNVEVENYCQAIYDYEATCDEELTFFEGQIIKILRKSVHDVDDGWWEGEVDNKIGLFPSLVVEELKDNGEPKTPVGGMTPEGVPPPTYTPPKPQFLVPPAQVTLTQPTPEIEHPGAEIPQTTVAIVMEDPDFQLELSDKHQAQYQTQFSASDSESSEHEAPVAQDVGKYAPLISSPDSPTRAMAATLKESVEKRKSKSDDDLGVTNECPVVVITEPPPGDFSANEDDSESNGEVKVTEDMTGNTYCSGDKFECTFPDDSEFKATTINAAVKFSEAETLEKSEIEMQAFQTCNKSDQDSHALSPVTVDSNDVEYDIEMTNVGVTVIKPESVELFQNSSAETTG